MSHHTDHLSAHVRHPHDPASAPTPHHVNLRSISDADIAKRAYEKYEARGRVPGFDLEDWTAASRELTTEPSAYLTLKPEP